MKLLRLLWLLIPVGLFAQSAQRSNIATQTSSTGFLSAISGATVYVCAYNAQLQCNSFLSVYSDAGLTQGLAQPIVSATGYYSYYIANGTQVVEKVCNPFNQCTFQGLTIGTFGTGGGGGGGGGPFLPLTAGQSNALSGTLFGTNINVTGSIQAQRVAGYTTPEFFGAKGDNVTDDTAAIQACWNYSSSTAGIICRLNPVSGTYLVNGQLVIKTLMNVEGSGAPNGTIIRSEFNGDAIVINSNPVQSVTMKGFELKGDATLASQRGFHIQGVNGGSGNGGLWDSTFEDIEVDFTPQECIWLDGGGGVGYAFNLPNQFLIFKHFNCNGPAQTHTPALVRISGQSAQVKFIGGQINGDNNFTHYPNPLIELNNKTNSLNDGPGDINFDTVTIQSGAICVDATWGFGVNFHNGYFENCGTGLTSAQSTLSVIGNTFNNNGTGFNFSGTVRATVQDSTVNNSGAVTFVSFGTCTNANFVSLKNNSGGEALPTSGCVTVQQNITSSTLTVLSSNVLLNGDSGATPITNISAPQGAGNFLTLFANGQYFELTSGVGGNISFGSYPQPLVVQPGAIVTLGLYDLGTTWQVLSVSSDIPAQTIYYANTGNNPVPYISIPSINTNGSTINYPPVGNINTAGIPGGSNCEFVLKPSGLGSQYYGSAFCQIGGAVAFFHAASNTLPLITWVQENLQVGTAAPVGSCAVGQFFANTTGGTAQNSYYYCDTATLTYKLWPVLSYSGLTVTTTGTNCATPTYNGGTGTLNIPPCTNTGLPVATDTFDTVQVNGSGTGSILTPATTGTWEAVQNGGADNSGAVDASSILQTKINAGCASSQPPRIHLSAGTYTINSGVLISATSTTCKGIVIEGDGSLNTILQTNCSGNSYGIWYNNTTNSGEHFNGPAIRHLQIKGSGGSACTYGLRLTQTARAIVEDVIITGFTGQTYSTGTVSTTGTALTGTGTAFVAGMVHGFVEVSSGNNTTREEVCGFTDATHLTLCDAFPTGNLAGASYAIPYGGAGLVCDPGFSYTQYSTFKDVYSTGNLVGVLSMGSTTGGCSRITLAGKAGYISPNPGSRITDAIGVWLGHGSDTWDVQIPVNNTAACFVLDSGHANKIGGECENGGSFAAVTTCNGGVASQACTAAAEISSESNGHGWNNQFIGMYAWLIGNVYQYDNATAVFNSSIVADRTLSGGYTNHYYFYGTTTCPGNGSGIPIIISNYDCNHQLVTQTVN